MRNCSLFKLILAVCLAVAVSLIIVLLSRTSGTRIDEVSQLNKHDNKTATCFELASDLLPWENHRARAEANWCTLASIVSEQEQTEASNVLTDSEFRSWYVWLGGRVTGTPGVRGADNWAWSDGQAWKYENFKPGEPNNLHLNGGDETRLVLNNGGWEDAIPNITLPALYKCSCEVTMPAQGPSSVPVQQPITTMTPGLDRAKCMGFFAAVYADPHIRTFDGVQYDCQGDGDFILVRSSQLSVQARFVSSPRRPSVSLTRAVVIAGHSSRPFQVASGQEEANEDALTVGGCAVKVLVDGQMNNALNAGALAFDTVLVTIIGRSIVIRYPKTGAMVSVEMVTSSSWGCYMNVYVCLQKSFSNDVVGLLGTPNGNKTDDWTDQTLSVTPLPLGRDLLFGPAYDYCTTNWCIANPADSLFRYDNDSHFFENCDAPYPGSVDIDSASQQLRDLCGDSLTCLVEGVSGSSQDAEEALRVEQIIQEAGNCTAGITAAYYNISLNIISLPDFDLLTPFLVEKVLEINYPSQIGGRSTYIAAVFDANLTFPSTGNWTLCLESDNGSRLRLDGQEVIVIPYLGRDCFSYSVSSIDQLVKIQISFWQTYGPMHLRFLWSGPSVPIESIVSACAFPPATNTGPRCIDFDCEEGYRLLASPETRPGNDRATCCFRQGVCAGAPAGSVCSLGDIGATLIPNPSFENFTSCPDNITQLNLAVGWVQATGGTSDYWIGAPTCPDDSWRTKTRYFDIPQNATDGDAFVGAIGSRTWYEYIGACLIRPLEVGRTYTFNLDIAAATSSKQYGGDTNGITEILCIPSCDDFPIRGADYKGDTFEVLASAMPEGGLVGGGDWKSITFVVTPKTQNCPAIMFGPGQVPNLEVQPGRLGVYLLYDFLNLQEGEAGVCNSVGECISS